MGNNPPHMGLSSLSGICLMFKNCLNLMETIISDWGRWNSRTDTVSKIRSSHPTPTSHHSHKHNGELPNPNRKRVKEQEINEGSVLNWWRLAPVARPLLQRQGEKEPAHGGIINPDDLALYSVWVIKSFHRLIMCEEPWHQPPLRLRKVLEYNRGTCGRLVAYFMLVPLYIDI